MFAAGALALGDLVLVMREAQVDTAGMDIELLAQVFGRHGGAFDMPAGEASTPGTFPVHLAAFVAMFPQREILWRVFILGNFHLLAPMTARHADSRRYCRKAYHSRGNG